MQIIKPDVNINFVDRRTVAYALSLLLILVSIASLIFHGGPKYGIDFAGGAEALANFETRVPIEDVKSALKALGIEGCTVQQYGDSIEQYYRILIPADQVESGGRGESAELVETLRKGLEAQTKTKILDGSYSFEMVGPQVGHDMREKALLSIFFALLFITVYISGRFELKWLLSAGMAGMLFVCVYALWAMNINIPILMVVALVISLVLFYFLNLKYAMGAIVALIHDVTITVGFFSLFGKEFTLPIIAALLTIIGYSLNDTIIVFDRIRENLRKYHKLPLSETINKSINETLSRTILTSGTTLAVVVCLFVFGGGIIHDFAFALLVGVLVGTYSSIFVASPILLAWQKKS